jgi:hypothetical protein
MYVRHLIPCPTIKLPASSFWCALAPLFEEEGNLRSLASVAKFTDPVWIRRPMTVTTLTSSDEPMDTCEINVVQRTKERLGADEAN